MCFHDQCVSNTEKILTPAFHRISVCMAFFDILGNLAIIASYLFVTVYVYVQVIMRSKRDNCFFFN